MLELVSKSYSRKTNIDWYPMYDQLKSTYNRAMDMFHSGNKDAIEKFLKDRIFE